MLHSKIMFFFLFNGFSMRQPNDVASFSSDRGVYVNNISMVYDCVAFVVLATFEV